MCTYVRVQEHGKITIPIHIRRKLKLRKGDLILLTETDEGILIKPSKVALTDALDEIGRSFRNEGISLKKWIERGRAIREQLIDKKYDLKEK